MLNVPSPLSPQFNIFLSSMFEFAANCCWLLSNILGGREWWWGVSHMNNINKTSQPCLVVSALQVHFVYPGSWVDTVASSVAVSVVEQPFMPLWCLSSQCAYQRCTRPELNRQWREAREWWGSWVEGIENLFWHSWVLNDSWKDRCPTVKNYLTPLHQTEV